VEQAVPRRAPRLAVPVVRPRRLALAAARLPELAAVARLSLPAWKRHRAMTIPAR
jgi:hypothetical protein